MFGRIDEAHTFELFFLDYWRDVNILRSTIYNFQ